MSNRIEHIQKRLDDPNLTPEYREVLKKIISEAVHPWAEGDYLETTQDIIFENMGGFRVEQGTELQVISSEPGSLFDSVWKGTHELLPTEAPVELLTGSYAGDVYYVNPSQAVQI